jgi:hypothetical protein
LSEEEEQMRPTISRFTAIGFAAALFAGAASLTACGTSSTPSAPVISDGQAPAPGSQPGIHSVADTDYEQIALTVDTAQIELDNLALEPARNASDQVKQIAAESAATLGPEAATLRAKMVKDGNAELANHHKAAVSDAAIATLSKLQGSRFDSAWARAMYSLNEQVIQAAVTEMNTGEDQTTRAMARSKIDYASAQNGVLKPLTGKQ